MYPKTFIINTVEGSYCSQCNCINLNWNNKIEQHYLKYSNYSEYKDSLESILTLYDFIKMYEKYLCGATIYFKKSKLKLNIKNIICLKYLRINLQDIHNDFCINDIFSNHIISDDIIVISLNVPEYLLHPFKIHNHIINKQYYHYDNRNSYYRHLQNNMNHNHHKNNCRTNHYNHNMHNHSHLDNHKNSCAINHYNHSKLHNHNMHNHSNLDNHTKLHNHNMHNHSNLDNNNHSHNHNMHNHSNLDNHNHSHNHNSHNHLDNHNHSHNHNMHNHLDNHNSHNHNMHNHLDNHSHNHNNSHLDIHHIQNDDIHNHNELDIHSHNNLDIHITKNNNILTIGIIVQDDLYGVDQINIENAVEHIKLKIMKLNSQCTFKVIYYKIKQDESIFNSIKYMRRNYCIDTFICGPINNELNNIKEYIDNNNILLLIFGMSILNEYLSKNILCLSPTVDLQKNAMINYIKTINLDTKYIITCNSNLTHSTRLANDVKVGLNDSDNIILDSSIIYDPKNMDMVDIYKKIKMQINIALSKNIQKENIYLYFVSSHEILYFINYLINSEDKLLETIKWIGADTNYLNFDNCSMNDLSDNSLMNDLNIDKIQSFLVDVNFITLCHTFYNSKDNLQIVETVGDHPSVLEITDCLWILATGFFIAHSYDNNKLKKTIIDISKKQYGLTGNLTLNSDGSRQNNKYKFKQASFSGNKFIWTSCGDYENL
mgnify:CR=1 FL=1